MTGEIIGPIIIAFLWALTGMVSLALYIRKDQGYIEREQIMEIIVLGLLTGVVAAIVLPLLVWISSNPKKQYFKKELTRRR